MRVNSSLNYQQGQLASSCCFTYFITRLAGNLIAARELTLDRAYAFNGKESLPDQLGASLSQDPKVEHRWTRLTNIPSFWTR